MEYSVKDGKKIIDSEKKVSRKLKKILSDAASAIKTALKVGHFLVVN